MPRLSFYLRTLLVVETVFCGFLGWIEWNRRIVHERQEAFCNVDDSQIKNQSSCGHIASVIGETDPRPMSFPRNLLGDKRMKRFTVHPDCGSKSIDRLRAAYPESTIIFAEDGAKAP
jgi:hypothetical protein